MYRKVFSDYYLAYIHDNSRVRSSPKKLFALKTKSITGIGLQHL